eukprot:232833-Chlamydomonas_euryale.AAC.3
MGWGAWGWDAWGWGAWDGAHGMGRMGWGAKVGQASAAETGRGCGTAGGRVGRGKGCMACSSTLGGTPGQAQGLKSERGKGGKEGAGKAVYLPLHQLHQAGREGWGGGERAGVGAHTGQGSTVEPGEADSAAYGWMRRRGVRAGGSMGPAASWLPPEDTQG